MKRLISFLAFGALAVVVAAWTYHAALRRRILDWGASPTEAAARLPGDELLEDADVVATRAITIEAPPSAIWPWLIQMGPGRGGVYTYDWIENLFGLDMHSADTVVPEWQSMDVGFTWRNPQGGSMRAEIVEHERAIVMRSEDGSWVWAFVLLPDGQRTRFVSRNRFRLRGGLLSRWVAVYLMEPGSLVMEQKMLSGIKSRAERLQREGRSQIHAPASPAAAASTAERQPEPQPALEPDRVTATA